MPAKAQALAPAPVCIAQDRAASLSVEVVDPARQPGWDDRVTRHPDYSFFHSAAWSRVLSEAYGYAPSYFTVSQQGELRALLPVMEVNSWLTGRRGIALPFTDHCEPLGKTGAAMDRCLRDALHYGQSQRWKHLECRGGRRCFAQAPPSLAFYGHTLTFGGDEADLFARLDSPVRRAIRKAIKAGVTVELSRSPEAMEVFYALQCRTRKRHGLPPQPFKFFRCFFEHVLEPGMGFVALARHQETPIAAAVFCHLGTKAVYKYGASDSAAQHLRGNDLTMWEAIQWYARNGFRTLDFGRTSLAHEGLRRFKRAWGTTEHQIEYVRYDLRTGAFRTDHDHAHGWHNWVFRRLPVSVSRMIGAICYQHMA